MENAAKALQMAAGVLISLLIVGALIYAYNNLAETKRIQANSDAEKQAVDFNKEFEVYNKNGLYGSELLSLANLVNDYNSRQATDEKGYPEITLKIKIENATNNFSAKIYTENKRSQDFTNQYKTLRDKVTNLAKTEVKGKTYAEWSKLSTRTISTQLNASQMDGLERYKDLADEQTEISRKTFDLVSWEYDSNGKIKLISFKEN